jgi:hypothetical protein
MAQQYDVSLKMLFHHSRGLIAQQLFGGPVAQWINVEQPKVTNIRVDLLARLENGRLRHVEFETKNEAHMGRRQAEYYLGFHRLLGEHVEQILLYAGQEPLRMEPVFETPSLRYEFQILDMRTFDGEPLLASEDWGDNLLALLTHIDRERVFQRVEAQIQKLNGEEQETAARLFVILSGIIGVEESAVRRLHMIDIMENKVLGPAIRQGIQKGKAEMLSELLTERFGMLPDWTSQRLAEAEEPDFAIWAKRVLAAKTLDEVFRP